MTRPDEPDSLPDAEVARRIAAWGEEAPVHEAELCRRYLNRARLYGLRHLQFDVTAAEDLAQQVMMVVIEALRADRVKDLELIPRDLVFAMELVAGDDRRPIAEYTVFHRLDVPKPSP